MATVAATVTAVAAVTVTATVYSGFYGQLERIYPLGRFSV